MGTFNKFLMFILAVVAIVAAIALIVLGSGRADAISFLSNAQWSMAVIIAGVVIIVIGGIGLIMAFSRGAASSKPAAAGSSSYMARPSSVAKRQNSSEFLTIPSNYGDIKVSFNTIRSLVERAAIMVEELKTTEITVGKKEDNIYLELEVMAAADLNIPESVGKLQRTVREYLENAISLTIGNVDVCVSNITNTYRKKADTTI